jgi:hypothetical protein
MRKRQLLLLIVLLLVSKGLCSAQDIFVDGVHLTTNKAPWTIRIPGNDLDITNAEAKPDEQSAYFMMSSRSSKLNVSVFIEPIDKCKSSNECRDYVLGLGNPEWGKFQDLSKGRIKDFSYFEFFRPEVQNQPMKILDMYAEYVSQGYWVDLHISKVLYKKEDHALFEKLVNSINFSPKSNLSTTNTFDAQLANGEKSMATWFELWDKMKCRESYASLSSISRKNVTEKTWIDWCTTVNTSIGKNNSRKLIAAAFTRSLPPDTDQPVGVMVYQSSFANRELVIELTGLLLEKDGSWSVTNYLTQ